MTQPLYWTGPVGPNDDFGHPLDQEFIDGCTAYGRRWAIMTPDSWKAHSGTGGKLGTGFGQRFQKQADGRWLKVEG